MGNDIQQIEHDCVGSRRVSTIREDRGPEVAGTGFLTGVFFETMTFGGAHECAMKRTRDAAEGKANHGEAVRRSARWIRLFATGERIGRAAGYVLLRVLDADDAIEVVGGFVGAVMRVVDPRCEWRSP